MNKINEIDNSIKKLMKVTFQPDDDSSKKFPSFHRRPQRSFSFNVTLNCALETVIGTRPPTRS